jgi:uncharacterized protein
VLAKPRWLFDRDVEWRSLSRFVDRGQRLAVVYGPRRIGKSYLLDALCEGVEGRRYQAIAGVRGTQLDDFGNALGSWLGAGPLRLAGWADALDRLAHTDVPLVVIDELPYLTETAPELTSLLQRYVDAKEGPPLVLAGSSLSTMAELVAPRAPLFGRSAAVVVPAPFAGHDLAELWRVDDPVGALWVDAAVGGLPGYRPLLGPPGDDLDGWMVDEVLAPSSPLLEAAEAALVEVPDISPRGLYRAILGAIAAGHRTFSAVARVAGLPSGALSRPLAALERAGLVTRVADPLRSRRDAYDLADPHLRTWLTVIAPHRSRLQAGRAAEVWEGLVETTWRAQVLGPRWEAVARAHLARSADGPLGAVDLVGATTVADRSARTSHEVDIVAVRGGEVVAVGEAKLRRLGTADVDRLRHVRGLVGAPDARIVLASADGVHADAAGAPDVVTVTPGDVYGT